MPQPFYVGQEAICPDGLGRVVAFDLRMPNNWVQVDTYIDNRGCQWDRDNIRLIPTLKPVEVPAEAIGRKSG